MAWKYTLYQQKPIVQEAASQFLPRSWMLSLIALFLRFGEPGPGLRLCLPGILASATSFTLAMIHLFSFVWQSTGDEPPPALPSFSAAQFSLMILQCLLYRSLFYAGADFMALQWDALLHEMGFWTTTLPLHPLLPLVALRLLAVKFFVLAGACKFLSEDPLWRHFRALEFHFETQPLPTKCGALLHAYLRRCPLLGQMTSAMTMVLELAIPLLSFGVDRYCRFAAFVVATAFMTSIALTGNFGFFNFLAAVLALAFLGDDVIEWTSSLSTGIPWVNVNETGNVTVNVTVNETNKTIGNTSVFSGNSTSMLPSRLLLEKYVQTQQPLKDLVFEILVVALLVVLLLCYAIETVMLLMEGFNRGRAEREKVSSIPWTPWMRSMGFCQSYGLFATVEQVRKELVIFELRQGLWRELRWRYKPGDVFRPLGCCSFHLPRLDWLLWLAAIRIGCDKSLQLQRELQLRPMAAAPEWFNVFLKKLMEERDPALLSLLNEQDVTPPEALRVELHHYELVGSCCCGAVDQVDQDWELPNGSGQPTWRRRKVFDVT
eukprot:symbB.v1.2.029374.t1/scaffold3208.1/size61165/2